MESIKKGKQNIDLVTFFKGVAIFMVVSIHTAQPFNLTSWLKLATSLLLLGCQIFFVLSAFTLCLSFERKPQTYGTFIKRRVLRLLPGYWTTILITQIISYLTILVLQQDYVGVSHKPLDIGVNLFLLNGLTPTAANNSVVRGGWFVGTVVLLYLLFPLLYKLYFIQVTWWKKCRVYLFPLLITVGCIFLLLTIQWVSPSCFSEHRGFLYNSFINQLPCFSIGLSLFELYKNQTKVKLPLLKTLFFLIITIFLFAGSWQYNWLLYPTTFGISFMYIYLFFHNQKVSLANPIGKLFISMGKVNFGIYLIHAFFAYEMIGIYIRIYKRFFPSFPSVIAFIIALPVVCFLSWFAGKWYEKLFNWIDSHTLKRIFK